MRSILRTTVANREILRLHGSWAAAAIGNWSFTILLALYAYDEGGTSAVGIAALVRMLPSALAASYTALLADRHSRRTVLALAALIRGLLLVLMGLTAAAGAPLIAVLVPAAIFTAVGTASRPAQAALLPQLARTPEELGAANVAWTSLDNLGFLLGSAAAGALAALLSLPTAIALAGVPFLLAALVLRSMPTDARPPALPDQDSDGELLEGFRTVGRHPELRLLVGLYGTWILVEALLDVLLVVAAIEILGMGEAGAGWLSAAWGVGTLFGGALALIALRAGKLASAITGGALLSGVPIAAIGVWTVAGPALALMTLTGVGLGLLEVALLTLTQRLAADDVLARVYGVQETVSVVAIAVGSMAAAGLVALLGTEVALLVTGAILPVVALLAGPRLGAFEAGAPVPERAFALLRAVPAFAGLPIATVETLAIRAHIEAVAPGVPIIRQGAAGDTFYVIDDGSVDVTRDGAHLITRGRGEFFGEIALLRDVPRTATVTAATELRVLVLDRDDFLAAVGAHRRSEHEMETAVREREATLKT